MKISNTFNIVTIYNYTFNLLKRIYTIMSTQLNQATTHVFLDENGQPIEIRPSTRVKDAEPPKIDMWVRLKNPLGTIYLPEILKSVTEQSTLDDKLKMIRAWWVRDPKNAELMRTFMLALYHPGVRFAFPKCKPPFHYNDCTDFGMAPNTLFKAVRKLKLLSDGPDKITNAVKRENMLIQQLETLYSVEADLYLMIIFKEIDQTVYPGIDEDFLRLAFSAVLPPKK